ncbi:hypothetical protein LRAMOSA03507 [Lichtheimia ramosa]|uniref:Uncharacterized protein n=1 Tax=Lichtheimia ramosa TaxID=688394 RepID=A0A077WVF2_9FUNG|nr:hypothetical protein LRAMOSA03507 [Lichtheimia ramosa]
MKRMTGTTLSFFTFISFLSMDKQGCSKAQKDKEGLEAGRTRSKEPGTQLTLQIQPTTSSNPVSSTSPPSTSVPSANGTSNDQHNSYLEAEEPVVPLSGLLA